MKATSVIARLRLGGRRKARLAALGVSLALHAVLTLLLLRAPAPSLAPAPLPPPLEMEILTEAPVPAAPVAAAPAGDEGQVAAPDETAPPRRWPTGRRAAPSKVRPAPAAPAAAEPEGSLVTGDSLLRMRPPPPLALGPSYDTVDRLTREGVIAPPDTTLAPPGRPRGPTFSERLAARVREDAARANVENGKVQPQLYDFMRDARRGFKPEPEVVDDDPRTPNTVGRTLSQWGRWLTEDGHRALADERRRLRQYHAQRRGEDDKPSKHDRIEESVAHAAKPMACVVCLVLRPESPPEVVLQGSSGNGALDRSAVEALRRAANTRPIEPGVKPQRTCYKFQATVFRVPPLPVVGCGLNDEKSIECVYPLKKLLKTKVTLESVDYEGG